MNDIDRHTIGYPHMNKEGVLINEFRKVGNDKFSCLLENKKEYIFLKSEDIITKKSDGTFWELFKIENEYWIKELKLKQ